MSIDGRLTSTKEIRSVSSTSTETLVNGVPLQEFFATNTQSGTFLRVRSLVVKHADVHVVRSDDERTTVVVETTARGCSEWIPRLEQHGTTLRVLGNVREDDTIMGVVVKIALGRGCDTVSVFDVNLKMRSVRALSVHAEGGSLSLHRCRIKDGLMAVTGDGDVSVRRGSLGGLSTIDTKGGNVRVDETTRLKGTLNVTTDSGDVDVPDSVHGIKRQRIET